jgi:hypothetical protein
MSSLRSRIIRLATVKPELRPHLLPLLQSNGVFAANRPAKVAITEWPTEKARRDYLNEHPNADERNHVVKDEKKDQGKDLAEQHHQVKAVVNTLQQSFTALVQKKHLPDTVYETDEKLGGLVKEWRKVVSGPLYRANEGRVQLDEKALKEIDYGAHDIARKIEKRLVEVANEQAESERQDNIEKRDLKKNVNDSADEIRKTLKDQGLSEDIYGEDEEVRELATRWVKEVHRKVDSVVESGDREKVKAFNTMRKELLQKIKDRMVELGKKEKAKGKKARTR